MKKTKIIAALALSVIATGALGSCGGSKDLDVALVTDVGNIDDHSFNQTAWEGTVDFCEQKGLEYEYYRPSEDTDEARIAMMESAIEDGADVLVLPGYLFENATIELQTKYPNVKFLLLDGDLKGNHDVDPAANTACVIYKEEQPGFMAGYAAVMEGYTNIGFIGGMAVPAVIRFGHGYVAGANEAAKVLQAENPDFKLNINYGYTGGFVPNDTVASNANAWFSSGVETIFVCGGKIYQSVLSAIESYPDATMIGVDSDQGYESNRIITSAMKELHGTVVDSLTALWDAAPTLEDGSKDLATAQWPSGIGATLRNLGVESDAVGLAHGESWRLKNFTEEEYLDLYSKIKSGELTVSVSSNDQEHPTVEEYVTVYYTSYK